MSSASIATVAPPPCCAWTQLNEISSAHATTNAASLGFTIHFICASNPDVPRRVRGSLKRNRRTSLRFFSAIVYHGRPGSGFPMRLIAVTAMLVGALASAAAAARQAGDQTMKSQWDRVYSLQQAKRGEALYAQSCAACHAPDLTGGEFAATWNELTLGDLFERIRVSMPQNDPPSLSRAQKADILAYVLFKGSYPDGEAELPSQTEVLRTITFLAMKPDAP